MNDDNLFPGYLLSAAEGTAAGAIGYGIVSADKVAGDLLGRRIANLTPFGTGLYSGFVTVMHTLLMEDFRRLRNFIKNRLPTPLNNQVVHLAIDTTNSCLILAGHAGTFYLLGAAAGYPLTFEDTLHLSCIAEAANLAVNHLPWGLYKAARFSLKYFLGIKQD